MTTEVKPRVQKQQMSWRFWELKAWLLLVVLPILPIWLLDHFPTQDGFAHLQTVRWLESYLLGGGDLPDVLVPTLAPFPNWGSQFFLLITSQWLGLDFAHRMLLTGYVVLFPLVFRWNMRALGHGERSWFILPITLNHFLFFGFYNYLLGLIVVLVLIGVLIRVDEGQRKHLGWFFWAGVSCLCLLSYFCHLIAGGLACVSVLVRFRSSFFSYIKPICLALLPVGGMLFWYVVQAPSSGAAWQDFGVTFYQLLLFAALFPFSKSPELSGLLFVIAWIVLFVAMIRFGKVTWRSKEFLFVFLLFFTLVLCFIMPDRTAGGAIIQYRLTILPWIFFIAVAPLKNREIQCFFVLLAMWVYGQQLIDLTRVGRGSAVVYQNYERVMAALPDHSVVLNLNEEVNGEKMVPGSLAGRVGIFEHAHAIGALSGKPLILLNHYQALWTGFPFAFKEKVDWTKSRDNPDILRDWEKATGRQIEYLVIQGEGKNRLEPEWAEMFEADLSLEQGDFLKVWVRKK
jgi:hypothetical protein